MSQTYVKISSEVEAMLFNFDEFEKLNEFTGGNASHYRESRDKRLCMCKIRNSNGYTIARGGDYVIKLANGNCYAMDVEEFESNYVLKEE